jgi:hypothetical protein
MNMLTIIMHYTNLDVVQVMDAVIEAEPELKQLNLKNG